MQLPSHPQRAGRVPWAGIPSLQGLDAELTTVRDLIGEALHAAPTSEELAPLYDYLCVYTGKMIRPALVLLAGRCCGQVTKDHLKAATLMELIHTATLLHDDVIDDGQRRRGAPTINNLCGNESAVLLGDFVLSRVFKMVADFPREATEVIAGTTARVCEGELRQVLGKRNWQLDEVEYIDIITEKSAAFFSACCRLGAMLANASQEQTEALSRYGLDAGIAFQITDDILDLTGDERQMGKAAHNDFDTSKLTLAVIHLLARADTQQRDSIVAMLGSPAEFKAELLHLLRYHGSLRYARQRAQNHVVKALEALDPMPPGPAKEALVDIAQFMVGRTA